MTTTIEEQNGNNVETSEAAATFAEMLDEYEYTLPQRGQILQGEIIRIEDDAVFMNVGAKRDAIVPHTDLDRLDEELIESLQTGNQIPVYVLRTPVGDEELLVSINKGLEQKDWTRAEELIDEDETLELTVCGYNKGGLLVQFGQLEGFVPNSHVPDLRYSGAHAEMESRKAKRVGETLLVKVLEVDQQRRRLIFSAKAAHKEQRRRRLQNLEVGSIISGRVANIVNYGAFVDIGGGVSGLLHVSEIAWHRVEHPSKILSVGEELDVEIQNVDVDRERVSLSRKAVIPNPWDTIEQRHNIGDLIEGRVTNIEDFGAFVEVQKGVVGLVHVSEIDIYGPATIHDIIQPGDEVLVRIIDIDPYEERLSLSLRRVTSEEQIKWMQKQREAEDAAEAEASAELDEAEAAAELTEDGTIEETAEAEQPEATAAEADAEADVEAADDVTMEETAEAEQPEATAAEADAEADVEAADDVTMEETAEAEQPEAIAAEADADVEEAEEDSEEGSEDETVAAEETGEITPVAEAEEDSIEEEQEAAEEEEAPAEVAATAENEAAG